MQHAKSSSTALVYSHPSVSEPPAWSDRPAAAIVDLLRAWVATLRHGVIVPCEEAVVFLLPGSATARAEIVIDLLGGDPTREILLDTNDLPCDLIIAASTLDRDDIAAMNRIADTSPIVYAPNLGACVARLRDLVKALARAYSPPGRSADRTSATDLVGAWAKRNGTWALRGPKLAALRAGDGTDHQTVFFAQRQEGTSLAHLAAGSAFVPHLLEAAAFVAAAERVLKGLYAGDEAP